MKHAKRGSGKLKAAERRDLLNEIAGYRGSCRVEGGFIVVACYPICQDFKVIDALIRKTAMRRGVVESGSGCMHNERDMEFSTSTVTSAFSLVSRFRGLGGRSIAGLRIKLYTTLRAEIEYS